jgi:hypothetical protein
MNMWLRQYRPTKIAGCYRSRLRRLVFHALIGLTAALHVAAFQALAATPAANPATNQPATNKPASSSPASSRPVSSRPVSSRPAASKPATAGPAAGKPAAVGVTTPPRGDVLGRERQKIDEVIAAAVVSALSDELGGRQVEIRLDPLSVQTSSLRDRLVSGRGEMQIDGAADWVGFSFNALYDAVLESAGYPELRIGGVRGADRVLPNDARLIRELDDRVIALVGQEFGYQQVRMQLDQITTMEAGARYLRIDAQGLADFGLDGTAPTHVEALYDRTTETWLRVAYVLQPSAEAGLPPVSAQPEGGRTLDTAGNR